MQIDAEGYERLCENSKAEYDGVLAERREQTTQRMLAAVAPLIGRMFVNTVDGDHNEFHRVLRLIPASYGSTEYACNRMALYAVCWSFCIPGAKHPYYEVDFAANVPVEDILKGVIFGDSEHSVHTMTDIVTVLRGSGGSSLREIDSVAFEDAWTRWQMGVASGAYAVACVPASGSTESKAEYDKGEHK